MWTSIYINWLRGCAMTVMTVIANCSQSCRERSRFHEDIHKQTDDVMNHI